MYLSDYVKVTDVNLDSMEILFFTFREIIYIQHPDRDILNCRKLKVACV